MKKIKLTTWIVIALCVGALVGYLNDAVFLTPIIDGTNPADPGKLARSAVSGNISILSSIFLRLIKMIIAPLVFSTLVVGIARMGDIQTVGRIGLKTMVWFISASLVSLCMGLLLVNLFQPGLHFDPSVLETANLADGASVISASNNGMSLAQFILHIVPANAVDAMARNEIIQIVVFSVFFGIACAGMGDKAKTVVQFVEELSHLTIKITGFIMNYAPIAVFAATAALVTREGITPLLKLAIFMIEFYVSLIILWLVMIGVAYLLVGKRVKSLINNLREPLLLAFGTASSEAAYPKTLEGLTKFGVKKKISSFVLPIGYSFNLDGSMMYCTFAVLFIAQVARIDLTAGQQITMLLLLMVTSKGMAGVPRASLVVIAATLHTFNLPEAGIPLILAVDQFLDMGRSATNVVGNGLASVAVAKWEGDLSETSAEDDEDVPATVI